MDRREAIRVIKELLADRDNGSRYPCVSSPRHYEALDLAIEALKEPIEIVHCKECKYWQEDEKFCDNEFGMYVHTRADDFCFQGKRKLNNPDDSLVSEDSEDVKEQESKLESDLISRQAAIEAVEKAVFKGVAKSSIESLPPVEDMGEVSDGYHTFNQLYHQRAVLFATIVNQNKDKAWKSWKHEDEQFCFDKGGEWFIVGVDTPEGSYTYHYENKYWDLFDCEELDMGKHWDGHTEEDVTRLLSLPPVEPKKRTDKSTETHACDCISRQDAIKAVKIWFAEEYNGMPDEFDELAQGMMSEVPPVEPKRPKGEWIFNPKDAIDLMFTLPKCSKCGFESADGGNFCPNCGADMRGDKDV